MGDRIAMRRAAAAAGAMWSRRVKLLLSAATRCHSSSHLRPRPLSTLPLHPLPRGARGRFFDESKLLRLGGLPILPESTVSCRDFCSSEAGIGSVVGHPTCWNCAGAAAATGPFLSCGLCGCVQPVDRSIDYFQIFGLKKEYNIGDGNLEGKYKDWQKKLHPDLVHSKSEREKNFAAEQSARVIDAYRTLSKPLLRALYLLRLEGIHVDEEKTIDDPDLLVEMMELRESVEDANDDDSLKEIQFQIESKFKNSSNAFQQAFEKKDFEDAISATQRMRYYDRALEEIVKKL